jgi:hypothetical protein
MGVGFLKTENQFKLVNVKFLSVDSDVKRKK